MLEAIDSLSELRNRRANIINREIEVLTGLLLFEQEVLHSRNVNDNSNSGENCTGQVQGNILYIRQGIFETVGALRTMHEDRANITNREREVSGELYTLFQRE